MYSKTEHTNIDSKLSILYYIHIYICQYVCLLGDSNNLLNRPTCTEIDPCHVALAA